MTTIGMRVDLTLDDIKSIVSVLETVCSTISDNPELQQLRTIAETLSVLVDHAGTMYHPADLTIEVRP